MTPGVVSHVSGWSWEPDATDPGERENPTGCYRRTFEVPDEWMANGRRVFALIEAGWCNFKLVETRVDNG